MARDRYFFDKRVIKKGLIKYGVMFVIALPILVVMNIYVIKDIPFWGATMIDVAILLAVVILCLVVYGRIEAKRKAKQEELERQRKELAKAQRKAKKQAKKNKAKSKQPQTIHKVDNVEIVAPDDEEK